MSNHRTRMQSSGRVVAADAALAITDADGVGDGTIIISSTTSATKTATFSFNTPTDTLGGPKFEVYMSARSDGAYAIAATYGGTAGTVTFNAQHEYARFARIGSTLYCTFLSGATFA